MGRKKQGTEISVKSNTLIKIPKEIVESKLHVNPNQMDIITIVLAQVGLETDIDENLIYSLTAKDFAELKHYKDTRTADKILKERICGSRDRKSQKSIQIYFDLLQENGKYESFSWFDYVSYYNGVATFEISPKIKNFLVDIKKRDKDKIFARLQYILALSSQYSKRIYLMCRAFTGSGSRFCDNNWELFLEKLGVPLTMSTSLIKSRILNAAVEEINELTDINISYTLDVEDSKGGKKPVGISFDVTVKDQLALPTQ